MNLKKRLFFFGIGLSIGAIIVIFFLKEKGTSFDYLPNARVLKDIRTKTLKQDSNVASFFKSNQIDSIQVYTLLEKGNVDFGKSIIDSKDTCNLYVINSAEKAKLQLQIKNCDSIATITHAKFLTE